MHDSPRRRVLRTGGALLTGGLAVGLGGCLQNGDEGGQDTETDDDEDTDDGDSLPAYAEWLPAPAALNVDHYDFVAVDTEALVAADVSSQSQAFDGVASLVDGFEGVQMTDLSAVYLVDSAVVAVGDVGGFRSALEGGTATEIATWGEFTVYEGATGGAVAVSAEAAIRTRGVSQVRGKKAEAIVDARRGEADRYTDVSEDCRRLVGTLGTGAIVGGRTRETGSLLDGLVADGIHWTLDESAATYAGPFVFESESAVDVSAVERLVADDGFFRSFESTSVTSDGRVAVVEGTTDPGSLQALGPTYESAGGGGGGGPRPPQVSFSFDYETRADGVGLLVVRHEGGDMVRASELVFRGAGILSADALPEGEPGDTNVTASGDRWPAARTSSRLEGAAAVSAGDRVPMALAADADLGVVWESSEGETSATLATYQGPNA